MSEVIVRMEMPTGCADCNLVKYDDYDTMYWCPLHEHLVWSGHHELPDYRMNGCPIIGVLPEQHGDLIDRDIMYKQIQLWKSTATDTITLGFLYHIEKLLMSTRPIIAATERSET